MKKVIIVFSIVVSLFFVSVVSASAAACDFSKYLCPTSISGRSIGTVIEYDSWNDFLISLPVGFEPAYELFSSSVTGSVKGAVYAVPSSEGGYAICNISNFRLVSYNSTYYVIAFSGICDALGSVPKTFYLCDSLGYLYVVRKADSSNSLLSSIDSTLNQILSVLGGSSNGMTGIFRFVNEIATVSWRIDSSLSDLSDTLTSVISNGKVLVDNSDIVSAIQSIPAFDDTNIVRAINAIPGFSDSGIITVILDTSDAAIAKLSSLLTSSDEILGAVNGGNTILQSINSRLSTISGLLSQIVSSGGASSSISASAISDPIVSAIDNLRVSVARQISDTWFESTTRVEYLVPAFGTCYIPLPVGDSIDYDSWGVYFSELFVLPGNVEVSPDIIDSSFVPSDYGFGESYYDWYTIGDFAMDSFVTSTYFSGVTVVNTTDSFVSLYVWSPSENFTSSLYSMSEKLSSKLTLILNRIPSTGSSDLTTLESTAASIESTLSIINDKLDNTATKIENTTVNITNNNSAYNVFYVTDEDGNEHSITSVAGDSLSAGGKLLNFLYKLVVDGALSGVDGAVDGLGDFFFDSNPSGLGEGVSVWD